MGAAVVVAHGGGPHITKALEGQGIKSEFIEGQRITTPEMITVVVETLKKTNRELVDTLKEVGLRAYGVVEVERVLIAETMDPRLQRVGRIVAVENKIIETSLASQSVSSKEVLVIAPIGVSESGELYNINADWAASELARSMKADFLVFLTNQDGILDASGRFVPTLDSQALQNLIESQAVRDGMLVKSRAAISALQGGTRYIKVINGKTKNALLDAFTPYSRGTTVLSESVSPL